MFTRHLLAAVFAVCLGLAVTVPFAQAQQDAILHEPDAELSNTLGLAGVARELDLTADQQFELSDLPVMTQMRLQRALRDYEAELGDSLPVDLKNELRDQLLAEFRDIREWEQEQLKKILTDDQIERLRQLRTQHLVQHRGGLAALLEELELSPSQLKQIRQIAEDLARDQGAHQRTGIEAGIPRADIDHDLQHMRQTALEKLLTVLDGTQRQTLERLQGKPFDFVDRPAEEASEQETGDSPDDSAGG
jgi:hypothetical protein